MLRFQKAAMGLPLQGPKLIKWGFWMMSVSDWGEKGNFLKNSIKVSEPLKRKRKIARKAAEKLEARWRVII
jgi:hypothetical protein